MGRPAKKKGALIRGREKPGDKVCVIAIRMDAQMHRRIVEFCDAQLVPATIGAGGRALILMGLNNWDERNK